MNVGQASSPSPRGSKWRFVVGRTLAFAILPVAMVVFLSYVFKSTGAAVVGGCFAVFSIVWMAAGFARAYDQSGD